jgi:transcriptional regulator with XRE-family HTH domain
MSNEIDHANVPQFPEKLGEKLKAIRERLAMTPDQLAAFVGAKTGAEITAYENDEDDLLVSVLFGYAKLANVPVEDLLQDERACGSGIGRKTRSMKSDPSAGRPRKEA